MIPARIHHTERRCKGRQERILAMLSNPKTNEYQLSRYLWGNQWVVSAAQAFERGTDYYRQRQKRSPHEVQLCKERFAAVLANPSIKPADWRNFLHLDVAAGIRNPAMSMWLLENPALLREGYHLHEVFAALGRLGLPEYEFVRDMLQQGMIEQDQAETARRAARRARP